MVSMKRKYIWLIELIIWILIISIGFIFFIYKTRFEDNVQNTYYVFFDDVEGLVRGSSVRLMGINIGYVKDIKIFDNKVFISFAVTKKNFKLPECVTASIEFYGLGGSVSLELNPSRGSTYDINKEIIIPSRSYRVQDLWDGSALVSQVLIDIYGSLGRLVSNEDIIKIKPYLFQSSLVKKLAEDTAAVNDEQTIVIKKLSEKQAKYLKETPPAQIDSETLSDLAEKPNEI